MHANNLSEKEHQDISQPCIIPSLTYIRLTSFLHIFGSLMKDDFCSVGALELVLIRIFNPVNLRVYESVFLWLAIRG